MTNNYELIAIDLDGTLLRDFDKTISDKDQKAIKKCLDNGVKVVISSGRALENIKVYIDQLNIKDGYSSAFHGSTIFRVEDLEIVNETFIDNKVAKEIIGKIKDKTDIGLLVYTQKALYSVDVNNYINEYYKDLKNIEITILEDLTMIEEPISKILVKGDRKLLEEIKKEYSSYNDKCKILFSELDLLEFMSLNTNKGYSLEKIAELNGIDISKTIAIGDNYNDMEMIEKAGLGVAVNNAVDALKEKADYVTINNNNENAVHEVIDKFFNF